MITHLNNGFSLSNINLTPGVYNSDNNRVSLHIDEENKLYYRKVENGKEVGDKIYIFTANPTLTQRDHVAKENIGFITKGLTITLGTSLDLFIEKLLEQSDYKVIEPKVIISTPDISEDIIEVGSIDSPLIVTHTADVISPSFVSSDGMKFTIPDFQYILNSETDQPLTINTSIENVVPITYNLNYNEYKAKDYDLNINYSNGYSRKSEAVLPANNLQIIKNISILYKWYFNIIPVDIPENITFSIIQNETCQHGWIDPVNDTNIKDRFIIPKGYCAVLALPKIENDNGDSIYTMYVEKLTMDVSNTWDEIKTLIDKSSYKLYYKFIPTTGIDSEYLNLKINGKKIY